MDALHWTYLIGGGVNIALAGYNIFQLFKIRKMDNEAHEGLMEIDRLLNEIRVFREQVVERRMVPQDDNRPTMH